MKATETDLLAELEEERAQLDAAISVLKRRLGSPVAKADLKLQPTGEFRKLSVPAALERFAAVAKGPLATREIGEALRERGIKSKSKHYTNIIRTTLNRQGEKLGWKKLGDGRWEPAQPTKG